MSTCEYDSGSATGCQPLCDKPATHLVTYRNGSYKVESEVCQRHVRFTVARAYPSATTTTALGEVSRQRGSLPT